MSKQYEIIIDLEVHVEPATKTKIFCNCSAWFGGASNIHTCPVCIGIPGSLPTLNKQAVEYTLAVGLAASYRINQYYKFGRRNYFYPDNPQNYQILQLYLPIYRDGWVDIETESDLKKHVGIHEIHIEEDAGKLIHDEWEDCSLVDYNRNGVPLIGIVSEPGIRNAGEVVTCLERLRLIIQYLDASDCKLQEGSMRVDVNLSVREAEAPEFGTRVEVKNLNSFKAIARAIGRERRRQIELLEEGRQVIQETRRWDDNKENSEAMRSGEDAQDYRYFPSPDLVPVVIGNEWIARVKACQPELRAEKIARHKEEYGLPEYDARLPAGSKHTVDIFEETTHLNGQPKETPNRLMMEAMRLVKEQEMESEDMEFSPSHPAAFIHVVESDTTNRTVARIAFEEIFRHNAGLGTYVEENGLKVAKDKGTPRGTVKAVVTVNPQSAEDYRNSREKAMGFPVGQTIEAVKGKVDLSMVNQLVKELLADGDI